MYYIKLLLWYLKKREIQVGIIVALFIIAFSLIGWFIAKRANLTEVKFGYENCVSLGMDRGRDFFQKDCKDGDCANKELSDDDMAGFIEYVEAVKIECERKYRSAD